MGRRHRNMDCNPALTSPSALLLLLVPFMLQLATLVTLLQAGSNGGMTMAQTNRVVSPRARHYRWKVDYSFWAPDCVEKVILSINGQYPGPTIRARAGDLVVVELQNLLPTETVLLHWHGILQRGSPWYDGTGGVSQCAINPGETFVYKFTVDKAGTYFYHGHLGLQRSAGFYGSLIVDVAKGEKEPFEYEGELSIVLNDWWHKSAIEQGVGLSSNPFRWVGEPQSLLMEGRGRYDCALVGGSDVSRAAGDSAQCDASSEQCAPLVLRVKPGTTYRLRLASVASLASLNFQIQGHNMTVVEADGNYVEPVTLGNLNVYSGETYSVLLKTNDIPPKGQNNFWIVSRVHGRLPKTPPGLAVLSYSSAGPDIAAAGMATSSRKPAAAPALVLPITPPPPAPAAWDDTAFSVAQSRLFVSRQGMSSRPPVRSDQLLILLNTQNRVGGFLKWAINNISWEVTGTPFLAAIKYGLKGAYEEEVPPATYGDVGSYDIRVPPRNPNARRGSGVYTLTFNATVDVVLQNANTLTPNNSEIHPWHLHGHEFWVLGYGDGIFDPVRDAATFNTRNPPLRNTVPLFPYGWTALRFVADNPGVWPFHCHLEAHVHMGMGVLFAEGMDRLGKPPKTILGCGLTKRWLP